MKLEEADNLLQELNERAPHIRWKVAWHDHELGVYKTLEVPDEQAEEAQEILDIYYLE